MILCNDTTNVVHLGLPFGTEVPILTDSVPKNSDFRNQECIPNSEKNRIGIGIVLIISKIFRINSETIFSENVPNVFRKYFERIPNVFRNYIFRKYSDIFRNSTSSHIGKEWREGRISVSINWKVSMTIITNEKFRNNSKNFRNIPNPKILKIIPKLSERFWFRNFRIGMEKWNSEISESECFLVFRKFRNFFRNSGFQSVSVETHP